MDDLQPPANTVPQLSTSGRNFLIEVFHKYDTNNDDALTQSQLTELFSVFPYDPWGSDVLNSICTNTQGQITLKGFLSQWMLTTYLDTPRTLEYLGYLGYSTLTGKTSQLDAICYVRNTKSECDGDDLNRSIFTCKVIGSKGVGKSVFLLGLLGQQLSSSGSLKKKASVLAINEMSMKHNQQPVYLLMHEVNISDLLAAGDGTLVCDVVCLLYDVTDPDSFQPCVEVYKQFVVPTGIACVVVATKSENTPVKQHCVLQPEQFCLSNRLPPPIPSTLSDNDLSVYETIVTLASKPQSVAPQQDGSLLSLCLKVGLALTLVGVTTYGVYKYWNFLRKTEFAMV